MIVCAALAAIARPTSVEPVKATFATSGMLDEARPDGPARAGDDVHHALGQPASQASCSKRRAVSGVSSAGLSTIVLPAASAGAIFQAAIVSGKFHGVISADDAERLAER